MAGRMLLDNKEPSAEELEQVDTSLSIHPVLTSTPAVPVTHLQQHTTSDCYQRQ